MEKKQKTILTVITIALVLLAVAGSYAFFVANVNNDDRTEAEIKTANVSLRFADNDGGISASLDFGKSITKEFLIENNSPAEAVVDMYWKNLTNTYLERSLTYKLEYKTSLDSTEYIDVTVSRPNVPRSESPTNGLLAEGLTVPASTTYYYRLTITLEHLDDVDQTQDFNAKLSTWFDLKDGIKPEDKPNTLQVVGKSNYTGEMWEHKANITKVVFENIMSIPETYVYSYDISSINDSSVMAYLVEDETGSTKYVAHIQANGTIYANPDSSYLFCNFMCLKSIEGIQYFDTKNVTDMGSMFWGCSGLTSLDLSNIDTKKVTNMVAMFGKCSNLVNLNIDDFNTSNVTSMAGMFRDCSSLNNLIVNNFNTSKVIYMNAMFLECNSLKTLNLQNFDTRNVTTMENMFLNCSGLISLNLNNFNTSQVTNMHSMFWGCKDLISLDLGSFDTKSVDTMLQMFSGCSSLTSLNVSSFDTKNVTDMGSMFWGCSSLETLNLSNFNTERVTNMANMFISCDSLKNLDISNFNTQNVINMDSMFNNCHSLSTLDLSHFDTSNVTIMNNMFGMSEKLLNLNISNWDVSSVTNNRNMFSSVSSSIQITVSNTSMRTWVINASDSPKLTTSNFVVG